MNLLVAVPAAIAAFRLVPNMRVARRPPIASAMVNTSQQIGGSVGTAVLSSMFAGALSRYLASHPAGAGAMKAASVHGDTVAFA